MTDKGAAGRRREGSTWPEQVARLRGTEAPGRKQPITVDRIVQTAFRLIQAEGFDALTMRRVAAELSTGAASLYAHVRNKAELDDLLIGELCARVTLPEPRARNWQEQIIDVCSQLRDQFLAYPGVSRAALAAAPTSINTLRLNEGMLAILLAGGVAPQPAAWAIDAAYLYVSAYSLEASMRRAPGVGTDMRALDNDDIADRLKSLPIDLFPNTVAHAGELTSGLGHERFDFTLGVLLRGLERA